MNAEELKPVVEAMLFTLGGAVEAERMATATESKKEDVIAAAEALKQEYKESNRGIQIIELDGSYQMCTNENAYRFLVKLAHVPKRYVLSNALLEVLSIVAYKQPVTRSEITRIRGVNSDNAINKLQEYELIDEAGRLEAPGRPVLFGTTENFLRNFGIKSLSDLPVIDERKNESIKAEAEKEARETMGEDVTDNNKRRPSSAAEGSASGETEGYPGGFGDVEEGTGAGSTSGENNTSGAASGEEDDDDDNEIINVEV